MRKYWLWGLLVGSAVVAGSWVIAQQVSTPPASDPKAAPPATTSTAPSAPPASGAPAPMAPPNIRVPDVSPFPAPPPPPPGAIAAVVNGQTIPEMAVYRAVLQSERINIGEIRKEVIAILVDNALVDQYLLSLKINVEQKEVDDALNQLKKEAAEQKESFDDILKSLHMNEDELRFHLIGTLRWDKFVAQQSTDKALRDFFANNKLMFDGTQMQARHILVPAGEGTQGQESAKAKIAELKKQIETVVAQELAKLPAQTDAATREKEHMRLMVQVFGQVAEKESACESKKNGGDIGRFPRLGATVEPFARAAFALKPGQMSDAVSTEFGFHLILAVELVTGKEVKYEDMRNFVTQVYAGRLREAVLNQMKPNAKIVINPAPKTN